MSDTPDAPALPDFEGRDKVRGLTPFTLPENLFDGDGRAILRIAAYRLPGVIEVIVQSLTGVLAGDDLAILITFQVNASDCSDAMEIVDHWLKAIMMVHGDNPEFDRVDDEGNIVNLYVVSKY